MLIKEARIRVTVWDKQCDQKYVVEKVHPFDPNTHWENTASEPLPTYRVMPVWLNRLRGIETRNSQARQQARGTRNGARRNHQLNTNPAIPRTRKIDQQSPSQNQQGLGESDQSVNQWRIYPNPAQEFLYVETTKGLGHLVIYNGLGEAVHEIDTPALTQWIDVSSWAKGMYYLRSDSNEKVRRIVIQ